MLHQQNIKKLFYSSEGLIYNIYTIYVYIKE